MNYLEIKKKAIASFANKIKGFLRNSISVPPISLESCADNTVINYKLHGNSYQATRSGKNLLDINKAINERQESTLTSAAQYYPIQLKPNTSYTLTTNCYTDTLASIFINLPNVVSTTADNGVYAEATYRTATTDDTGILWIWTRVIDDGIAILDTSEFDNGTYWAQLEQGTTPTAYEQYGASPSPDYPSEVQSVGERIVPDEYQRVEYIETSGLQYINTGFNPNNNTKTELVFFSDASLEGSSYDTQWFEARKSWDPPYYGFVQAKSLTNCRFRFGTESKDKIDIPLDDTWKTITFNKNNIYINGELIYSMTYNEFQLTVPLYLFLINNNNSPVTAFAQNSKKVKSFKIWDNDVLVRNFIPCYRKSDNVIGMYDNVNDVFYTNQGSGAFLKGPDIGNYEIPVTARSKNYCNPIITGGVNANGKYSIDNKGIVSWKRTSVNASGGVMLKTFLKAGKYDFTIKIFNVSGYSPINSHMLLYLRNNLRFANGSSVSYGKSTLVVTEDSYIGFNVYAKEPNSEIAIGNGCSWSIMITDNGISGDDYEPYHEPITTNIYLDEPLRKVGDYADYIDFKNSMVVKNIENKVFNGSENWSESGYNPQITINYMQFWIDYTRNKTLCSSVLSNILESTNSNNWSNLNLEKEFILISTSGDIGIRLSKNRVSNLEEFKSLLSNNNMSVYFVSNTPTETSISLPILPTFKGISMVYEVGTTIQPSNMEAEYYSLKKS